MIWIGIGLAVVILNLGRIHGNETKNSPEDSADWIYLENKTMRVGFLKSSGASMAHLSTTQAPERNLLNHYDRGRLLQQSYYGDPDGSSWVNRPWRYNPVQGGDYQGKSSQVLELKHTPTQLYAKTIPTHWANGVALSECVMEQWITLHDTHVHMKFQMTYQGQKVHRPHHQEIPAIFLDTSLATLVTYTGDLPWTQGELTRLHPGQTNEYVKMNESWVAYVDEQGNGVGIYVPIAQEATCYRFLGGHGSDCSYVAPITTFALEPGLKFSYEAILAVGSLDTLRKLFEKQR